MAELGMPLDGHTSKILWDVPDAQNFDDVITVCDSAAEACPVYPGRTTRRHYPFADPPGGSLERWRAVRDQMRPQFTAFVQALQEGTEAPPSRADPSAGLGFRPPSRRDCRPDCPSRHCALAAWR